MEHSSLSRFVHAQRGAYRRVLSELRAGHKSSHWMWFIFPQLRGLGRSSTAHHYGIANLAEAQHFLEHPVLGKRLISCTRAVATHHDLSVWDIFGAIDARKFRSSMTLFNRAALSENNPFQLALESHCNGEEDHATVELLQPVPSLIEGRREP